MQIPKFSAFIYALDKRKKPEQQALRNALHTIGAAVIKEHCIAPTNMANSPRYGALFFSHKLEDKLAYTDLGHGKDHPNNCGYVPRPVGSGMAEMWVVRPHGEAVPQEIRVFMEDSRRLMRQGFNLGRAMLEALYNPIGVYQLRNVGHQLDLQAASHMRIVRYNTDVSAEVTHEIDEGNILLSLYFPALDGEHYIQLSNGQWLQAPIRRREVLLVAGPALQRITEGRLRAAGHKVAPHAGLESCYATSCHLYLKPTAI